MHGKIAITEHSGLLRVHGGHRCVVHLLHIPLLGETLDVEMEGVVDLLIEEDTAGLAAARTWWSGTKTGDKSIRHEIPVVQAAIV